MLRFAAHLGETLVDPVAYRFEAGVKRFEPAIDRSEPGGYGAQLAAHLDEFAAHFDEAHVDPGAQLDQE